MSTLPGPERRAQARTLSSSQARELAHRSWAATTDPTARTARARRAADQRFYDQVDPDRVLSPAERERRAGHARKAHFTAMARKSAEARRRKRAA